MKREKYGRVARQSADTATSYKKYQLMFSKRKEDQRMILVLHSAKRLRYRLQRFDLIHVRHFGMPGQGLFQSHTD